MPITNKGLYELAEALSDLGSADLRIMLMRTSYTFSPTHDVINDVVAHEITVTNYSRQALAGETVVEDDTSHRAYLDANDLTFSGLGTGQTIGGAYLFRHTGSDATAPVIAFIPITATPTNGDFGIRWPAPSAGGIMYLTSAA